MDSALRGRGIGQKFLRGLRRFSQELDAPFVLVEVESVESARTQEEAETRRRRIRFYERCGCRPRAAQDALRRRARAAKARRRAAAAHLLSAQPG